MKHWKAWISAMRLRTLPLAFSSILCGSAIAREESSNFWAVTGLALLTTLFLQVLSNFANDYGDFVKGTDNAQRIGPERSLQAGHISPSQMRKGMAICGLAALFSGSYLIYLVFSESDQALWKPLFFLGLGIGAIMAAIKYTVGKKPYGYSGYGDLFVFLFFGLIGVGGMYFLHSGHLGPKVILPAFGIGLLSAAVLHLNNMRDHINDAASQKRTLAVKLGPLSSKNYHRYIIGLSSLGFILYLLLYSASSWEWLILAPLALLWKHAQLVSKNTQPADLDPELKKVALATFSIALILFLTALWK